MIAVVKAIFYLWGGKKLSEPRLIRLKGKKRRVGNLINLLI